MPTSPYLDVAYATRTIDLIRVRTPLDSERAEVREVEPGVFVATDPETGKLARVTVIDAVARSRDTRSTPG